MKHTIHAEIWQLDEGTTVFLDGEETGETLAVVNNTSNGDGKKPLTHEEAVKLGQLMAAAPLLLEALKMAKQAIGDCIGSMESKLGCTDWGSPQREDFPIDEAEVAAAFARAAIAKAEGR